MYFTQVTGRVRRIASFLFASALGAGLPAANAQEVPATIKVLVGFPAGAGTDLMARAYAEALAKELKNTVIVENRPGAGGQIAARLLKDAPADGSTLMLAIDHQIVMIPHTVKSPGYDPQTDFQPIIQLATYDICAGVPGKSPVKSFAQWAKLAKESGEYRSIGVPAPGSNAHLLAKAIASHFGVEMNVVPYKGGTPLITDVSGGHVSGFVLPCGDPIVTAHESGRARILLTSADKGHPRAPQAISFAAAGLKVPSSEGYFMAVYASSRLPPPVADALKRASTAVAARPEMPARIAATGMVPKTAPPDVLKAGVARSAAAWGELIRKSGFEVE
jgi:tripartite-type tricarboxylate transporter receptor subunit TctC